jgi:SET domain
LFQPGDVMGDILEVRACSHGRGVFALRDFKERDLIQAFDGLSITTDPRSPPWKRWALIVGRTADGKHLFWDEEPEGSSNYWSNFLDHDNNPNVRFLMDMQQGRAHLIATRHIAVGDELLMDYREYDPDNWTPSQ